MSERVPMVDCGDGIRRADRGSIARGPHPRTADSTLSAMDTGRCFTNSGAGAPVTLTLPAPKPGVWFLFAVVAAQTLTIAASNGAKINNSAANGTYAAAGTQANIGNAMVWSDGVNWYVSGGGTWTTT